MDSLPVEILELIFGWSLEYNLTRTCRQIYDKLRYSPCLVDRMALTQGLGSDLAGVLFIFTHFPLPQKAHYGRKFRSETMVTISKFGEILGYAPANLRFSPALLDPIEICKAIAHTPPIRLLQNAWCINNLSYMITKDENLDLYHYDTPFLSIRSSYIQCLLCNSQDLLIQVLTTLARPIHQWCRVSKRSFNINVHVVESLFNKNCYCSLRCLLESENLQNEVFAGLLSPKLETKAKEHLLALCLNRGKPEDIELTQLYSEDVQRQRLSPRAMREIMRRSTRNYRRPEIWTKSYTQTADWRPYE